MVSVTRCLRQGFPSDWCFWCATELSFQSSEGLEDFEGRLPLQNLEKSKGDQLLREQTILMKRGGVTIFLDCPVASTKTNERAFVGYGWTWSSLKVRGFDFKLKFRTLDFKWKWTCYFSVATPTICWSKCIACSSSFTRAAAVHRSYSLIEGIHPKRLMSSFSSFLGSFCCVMSVNGFLLVDHAGGCSSSDVHCETISLKLTLRCRRIH